jgi:GNAT superfamily N-acetyltransferase
MNNYFNYNDYRIRKLSLNETVKSFNCGDADLNDFIINDANNYRKSLLAVTYVFEHIENGNIIAYFSLANDRVSLSDFKTKTEFNRFRKKRFVNEKRIKSYPAVKICRLGVSEKMKGYGVGTVLLAFIKRFFFHDNKTGCRFITVDAYSDAISFYERNNFQYLRNDDEPQNMVTYLLYYDLNDIA